MILAVANQKGGVGKTTTAVNLAAGLAELGEAVLLLDLDPQGNATSAVGAARSGPSVYESIVGDSPLAAAVVPLGRGLSVIPAPPALAGAEIELVGLEQRETRLRRALAPVAAGFRWTIIDCPPSLGLLTLNGLTAAGGVLVPVQCEYFALEGLARLITTIDRVRQNFNPPLRLTGLVMTMYDPRINLARDVVREVRTHFPAVFETTIPRSVRLSEAPSHGLPITRYAPASPAAHAYRALATELLSRHGAPRPLG